MDDPMRLEDQSITLHGGYLAIGTRIASGDHWRTWFTARGELMKGNDGHHDFGVAGTALRIATELYSAGTAGDRGVVAAGTFALGVYVEASYRDVPIEYGPVGVTSGMSLRLPFLVAGGK
jgi:hypothetical protein